VINLEFSIKVHIAYVMSLDFFGSPEGQNKYNFDKS